MILEFSAVFSYFIFPILSYPLQHCVAFGMSVDILQLLLLALIDFICCNINLNMPQAIDALTPNVHCSCRYRAANL